MCKCIFRKGYICALRDYFGPPLESKIENFFSQISFDWFIRIMNKV